MELQSGAGSWGCGSTWHGLVDGRAGCLDLALGVIDGGRVGGWKDAWWMEGCLGCSMEVVRWLLGVFNLGGLSEMELLMEEVVDGGGMHAVQMDLLINRVAVGG